MLVPTTGQLDGTRRKPIELQAALTYPRLVIVGDPGAGKTTFLRRIGYALSDSILNSGMRTSAHLSSDEMPSPTPEDRKKGLFIERLIRLLSGTDPVRPQPKEARPFPIFIRIAELAEHIDRSVRQTGRRQPTTRESPEWLLDFLNTRNNELNWSLRTDFFREKLKDTNCVLLLDGLDEATRRSERESMSRLFEQATRAFSKCRFVVTTRPLAYTGLTVLDNFQTARVEPIEQEAIHDFLQYWCRSLFPDSESAAGQHLNELSDALRTPEIKRMASNPVMLTALAVVHWNERRLPEQRVDLYESILNWLARAREKRTGRPSPERCLALLQELALAMQNHPTGRQSQVSRGWATAVLAERFIGLAEADRNEQAAEFLEQEEVDSGIIVSRGSDLRFWHLTFQEYLAARAMGGRPDSAQHALLLDHDKIYQPEWRELALLLGGVLLRQGPAKVDELVSALLDGLGKTPTLSKKARCVGLLGAMISDLQVLSYEPADPRYSATFGDVLQIFDINKAAQVEFALRLEAAEALGRAGDPRLLRDNWVKIEAGHFWMGAQLEDPAKPNYDPRAQADEGPVRSITLPAYHIGRYLVTVYEYQQFVESSGYSDDLVARGR
jgi:hypothetical protein